MEQIVKRSLSFALLLLHLLVFSVGGALATESAAFAAGPRIVAAVAPASAGAAAAIASSDGARLEHGTRPHGDRLGRGERGSDGGHGAPLDLSCLLPSPAVAVAPSAFVGLRDWRSAARGHRSLRRGVNAARGPPSR